MTSIRVGIVGVGNCAASLVQGVHYYRNTPADSTVPGLMHVQLGDYHISDIEFVAAFDVARRGDVPPPADAAWAPEGFVDGYWFGDAGIVARHQDTLKQLQGA